MLQAIHVMPSDQRELYRFALREPASSGPPDWMPVKVK